MTSADPHEQRIDAAMAEYMASAGQPETERMRLWAVVWDAIFGKDKEKQP